ncbi:hypothetical protein [Actinopolymorpha pittospori]|uniref:Uncharacterized protein n=1 Tax=Actinopolymorpha pittospori TaxID=648752 RepID=A0A927N3V6_9ACTN|nr:hypothetical protein [Actinopolymorpha pittospori]MBE1610478.1 hypothetical protein [Actinopolymorpha pittospori]
MSNPGSGLLRISRGGLLAVCCTALALLGHVSSGGGRPPVPALLAVTVVVGSAFAVLADRRRAFGQILVGALVAQVAFHTAFTLSMPGHHHVSGVAVSHGSTELFFGLKSGIPMLLGHLVAAVLVAVLAASGEALVWALYHLLGLVRLPDLAKPLPSGPSSPPPNDVAALPAAAEWLGGRAHPRRGPPRLVHA